VHRGAGAPGGWCTGGLVHRGTSQHSLTSWHSTIDNNANGGVGSFIYPFVNGFVVNDTDYPEEAQKTLKAGNLGGPLWQ
jgi:hypothetical protein